MGYFPKARHSQNDSENDDGRATGLGRAGRNDGGAAAASMGNRLGIAPARLRGRRRRYARTSPDTIPRSNVSETCTAHSQYSSAERRVSEFVVSDMIGWNKTLS